MTFENNGIWKSILLLDVDVVQWNPMIASTEEGGSSSGREKFPSQVNPTKDTGVQFHGRLCHTCGLVKQSRSQRKHSCTILSTIAP